MFLLAVLLSPLAEPGVVGVFEDVWHEVPLTFFAEESSESNCICETETIGFSKGVYH